MSQYPQPPVYHQPDPAEERAYQIRQDGEYLQILSILYYVMTGLVALGGCIPSVYMVGGLALMGGAAAADTKPDEKAAMMALGGAIFFLVGLLVVCIWTFAYCLYRTGRNLTAAQHPTFCFVMGCLVCLSVPFGTALGVFTIIVLNRPTIKERFAAGQFAGWQPPPEKQPPPFSQG